MVQREGNVIPLRRNGLLAEARRREAVRGALVDARHWIDAGIEGRCRLDEALGEAYGCLGHGLQIILASGSVDDTPAVAR